MEWRRRAVVNMGQCEDSLEWLNGLSIKMRTLQDLAEAHGIMDALHHSEIIHNMFNMLPTQFRLNMCKYMLDLDLVVCRGHSDMLSAFWKWLPS